VNVLPELLASRVAARAASPLWQVVDLLRHTLPGDKLTLYLVAADASTPLSMLDVNKSPWTEFVPAVVDNVPAGTAVTPLRLISYSNLAVTIKGTVVEHASGQRFGDYIRERINGPLDVQVFLSRTTICTATTVAFATARPRPRTSCSRSADGLERPVRVDDGRIPVPRPAQRRRFGPLQLKREGGADTHHSVPRRSRPVTFAGTNSGGAGELLQFEVISGTITAVPVTMATDGRVNLDLLIPEALLLVLTLVLWGVVPAVPRPRRVHPHAPQPAGGR